MFQVPPEYVGNVEHVLAVCDAGQSNIKVYLIIFNIIIFLNLSENQCLYIIALFSIGIFIYF